MTERKCPSCGVTRSEMDQEGILCLLCAAKADRGSCSGCRYFDLFFDGSISGECRRHAPTWGLHWHEDSVEKIDGWPKTNVHDWCGEYRPAGEEQ